MTFAYSMRISRLTVDKLGVKLYDKVSAVIAELIANAYDADATEVNVHAPMGQFLATRAGGNVTDKGFEIRVIDDGIGMTPQQVQDFFLVVGSERRNDPKRGEKSLHFKRKVMGRKGVGKLAPFGICKTIEVISAGGEEVNSGNQDQSSGFRTSHIILDYDSIVALDTEPDERYRPAVGGQDQTLSKKTGTQIILRDFNYRKVPDIETLDRQLAQRFGIQSSDWQIQLIDNTICDFTPRKVGEFHIDTMPNTRINFMPNGNVIGTNNEPDTTLSAGFEHDSRFYELTGWMAYSKVPYSDELMAGVRIYCRGKIAAQTNIFNQRAGFTGEHNIRSYLVGELHADWLDDEEDLIQTDRRDILWSDERTEAFQAWGQQIVKRIGTLSRDPMRKATLDLFLETGSVDERIEKAFPDNDQHEIRENAKEVARSFGRTISRAEAEDESVVGDLVDLSINLAPHITLDDMMKKAIDNADKPLSVLGTFLRTARLAELSSFGRIAEDRLKVIERLGDLKNATDTDETDLQKLISNAPWLVNPEWAPVTENQSFTTLRREFEEYYSRMTGSSISLSDFQQTGKRPDFVLTSQEGTVQIIEIKKPHHRLSNAEMDRVISYFNNMNDFLNDPAHSNIRQHFGDFHITIVCDELALSGAQRAAFDGYKAREKLTHLNWAAFLFKTEQVHQDFLEKSRQLSTTRLPVEEK